MPNENNDTTTAGIWRSKKELTTMVATDAGAFQESTIATEKEAAAASSQSSYCDNPLLAFLFCISNKRIHSNATALEVADYMGAKKKVLILEGTIADDVAMEVTVDVLRIRQILTNLIRFVYPLQEVNVEKPDDGVAKN
ncbi:unnamed protein product [Linum tenue]|uniref:Uncharacterized protein n=1 Tax=Linum tenue TaxID=586396 RepID=A0AAV0I548_9ROSI|nr:unnamed protein product [Linum tenue]